jgi:hypothetical protein
MVYSIVRGSEYFRVCVALVVRMRKGINEKKGKKSSQSVDQKFIQKRGGKERESGYHRDNKKTRASSTRERMIHRFLKFGTERQRPSLALDPVYPSTSLQK